MAGTSWVLEAEMRREVGLGRATGHGALAVGLGDGTVFSSMESGVSPVFFISA